MSITVNEMSRLMVCYEGIEHMLLGQSENSEEKDEHMAGN